MTSTPADIERRTRSVDLAIRGLSHPALVTTDLPKAILEFAVKIDKFIETGETAQ